MYICRIAYSPALLHEWELINYDLPFVRITISEALSKRVTGDLELCDLTVEKTEKDKG